MPFVTGVLGTRVARKCNSTSSPTGAVYCENFHFSSSKWTFCDRRSLPFIHGYKGLKSCPMRTSLLQRRGRVTIPFLSPISKAANQPFAPIFCAGTANKDFPIRRVRQSFFPSARRRRPCAYPEDCKSRSVGIGRVPWYRIVASLSDGRW